MPKSKMLEKRVWYIDKSRFPTKSFDFIEGPPREGEEIFHEEETFWKRIEELRGERWSDTLWDIGGPHGYVCIKLERDRK